MNITKLGHCCLLIEEGGLRILTDPGAFSSLQNDVKDIDVLLITHEHQDHLHMESLKTVLQHNPNAILVTNSGVAKLLDVEGIAYQLLEHGGSQTIKNVLFQGFGTDHALLYKTFPVVINTGYFIANRFFYPGDAFTDPGVPVEILALPSAGPWLTLANSVEYAVKLKPKHCFPVHDGMLKNPTLWHRLHELALKPDGIDFESLIEGQLISY